MLPRYTNCLTRSNRPSPTRWERFTDWICDLTPYKVFAVIAAAVILFFMYIIPHCPKCDSCIHPMDVYCSKCGHQLRTDSE